MSKLQQLLHSLLVHIYGDTHCNNKSDNTKGTWKYSTEILENQSIYSLKQIHSSLQIEICITGSVLETVLIYRDRYRRKQDILCKIITKFLIEKAKNLGEATEMKFSLSNPLIKSTNDDASINNIMDIESSDFEQWLQAMKMVARLPSGMPPEFRRKLWLALSEKYLQKKNVCWEKEEAKCFSETYREDDEELGIQIVKDLHRTGSSLCSGPAGSKNQAKLKKILLGYARWNPDVGYCQGFNMLGALILQVMDKNEIESMKVMIYLVEGVLPEGYFNGSLGGLQADMAVFRELMTTRLPKLAKHLQKLQGPMGEGCFEPPLTNVFTMQWFLTMFCTCLPINCVLRVWDLVLIEGSDVLLRTALAIWSILEERVIHIKTADDFYCKMGTLSGELLNGHLVDSNGLIDRVVKLGPIPDLQKMRDKHLYNITPWRDKTKGLKLYYSDEEADSDDDSHLAVTTAWGIRGNRRGSSGLPSSSTKTTTTSDNKDRLALDISILKKQYEKLRERQRQAHIILTTAVARQAVNASSSPSLQMNQLLLGRSAIVTNKGRRIGPPPGSIPPARKSPPLTMSRQVHKKSETVSVYRNEAEMTKRRKTYTKLRDTEKQKQSESANSSLSSGSERTPHAKSSSSSKRKSESSSYSEDSDNDSSTSTSLCDEENEGNDVFSSSVESSPLRKQKTPETEVPESVSKPTNDGSSSYEFFIDSHIETSDNENEVSNIASLSPTPVIPTEDDSLHNIETNKKTAVEIVIDEDSSAECDRFTYLVPTTSTSSNGVSIIKKENEETLETSPVTDPIIDDISFKSDSVCASDKNYSSFVSTSVEQKQLDDYLLNASESPLEITSTSQLSPIADISKYLSTSSISPLKTPSLNFDYSNLISYSSRKDSDEKAYDTENKFNITDEGVTNEYFERVNIVERPKYLDLSYSLISDDDDDEKWSIEKEKIKSSSPNKIKDEQQQPQPQQLSSPIDSILSSASLPNRTQYKTELSSQTDSAFETILTQTLPSSDDTLFKKPTFDDNKSELDTSNITAKDSLTDETGYEIDSLNNKNFTIEKSFSFHKPILSEEKQLIRPTSCPESKTTDKDENRIPTDRVLKIIEENSLILHRILRKTISDNRPVKSKENSNNNTSHMTEMKSLLDESDINLIDNHGEITSTLKSNFNIDEFSNTYSKTNSESIKTDLELSEKIDYVFQSKPTIDIKSTYLRTEDNITDRLESIKNTIKSIDSLCEDRISYKKDKCQRYIDSLFDNSNDNNLKIKSTIKPLIDFEYKSSHIHHQQDQQVNSNKIESNEVEQSTSSLSEITPLYARCSKNIQHEISPCRRNDDNHKEYESRTHQDRTTDFFVGNLKTKYEDEKNLNEKELTDCKKLEISNEWTKNTNLDTSQNEEEPKKVYNPGKLEIRHTTVTNTFYDRYLAHKMERDVIAAAKFNNNKSYYKDLRPSSVSTTMYNRISKSTENSPSRNQISLKYSSSDTNNASSLAQIPSINERHSYDNILSRLKPIEITSSDTQSLSSSSLLSPKRSSDLDLFKDLPRR